MTDHSSPDPAPPDPAPPGMQEEHAQVIALMNSADMQKRLQEARIKRAKVLEARNAGAAVLPEVREVGDRPEIIGPDIITPDFIRPDISAAVDPQSQVEPGLMLPAVIVQQPVRNATPRRSHSYSLVIGLVSGLALGSGLMWYSGFRFSAPAAPDIAGTLGQKELALDAGAKGIDKIAGNPFGVNPVPPVQPGLDEPKDNPFDLPRADQSPATPERGAFHAPQDADRVTVGTASATAPADADQPPAPLRPNPAAEDQMPVVTADAPPAFDQRTTPDLDAENAADQPPAIPVDPVAPRPSAGQIGVASNAAARPAVVPLQVALHLSPDLSQAGIDGAAATITTAGVELTSTRIASFSVLQSEVRFFHQRDAQSATKIAEDMRIRVRDYSTYRPVPAAGTLEIWVAQGS